MDGTEISPTKAVPNAAAFEKDHRSLQDAFQRFEGYLRNGQPLHVVQGGFQIILKKYEKTSIRIRELMNSPAWSHVFGSMRDSVDDQQKTLCELCAMLINYIDKYLVLKQPVPIEEGLATVKPFEESLLSLLQQLDKVYQDQVTLQSAVMSPADSRRGSGIVSSTQSVNEAGSDGNEYEKISPYKVFTPAMRGDPPPRNRPRSMLGQNSVDQAADNSHEVARKKHNSLPGANLHAVHGQQAAGPAAAVRRQHSMSVASATSVDSADDFVHIHMDGKAAEPVEGTLMPIAAVPKSHSHDSLLVAHAQSEAQPTPPRIPPKKRHSNLGFESASAPQPQPPPIPQKKRKSTMRTSFSTDVDPRANISSPDIPQAPPVLPPARPPKPASTEDLAGLATDGFASLSGTRPLAVMEFPEEQLENLDTSIASHKPPPPPPPDTPPPPDFLPQHQFQAASFSPPPPCDNSFSTAGVLGTAVRSTSFLQTGYDMRSAHPVPYSLRLDGDSLSSDSDTEYNLNNGARVDDSLRARPRVRKPRSPSVRDRQPSPANDNADSSSDNVGSSSDRSPSPPLPPPLTSPPLTPMSPMDPRPLPRGSSLQSGSTSPGYQRRETETSQSFFPGNQGSPQHRRRPIPISNASAGEEEGEAAPPIPSRGNRPSLQPPSPLVPRRESFVDPNLPPALPPKMKHFSGVGHHLGVMGTMMDQKKTDIEDLYGSISSLGIAINSQAFRTQRAHRAMNRSTSLYVSGAPENGFESYEEVRSRTRTVSGKDLRRPPALPPKKKHRLSAISDASGPSQGQATAAAPAVAALPERPPKSYQAPAALVYDTVPSVYAQMAESCPDIELPPPPPPLPEDSEPGPESVLQDEENNEELSDEYPMPGEEEDEQEEQEDEVPSLLKEDASQDFLFEENESDNKPLRAGTVDVMVAFAASVSINQQAGKPGENYVDIFLMTHRPFLSPAALLDKLLMRLAHFKKMTTDIGKKSYQQTIILIVRVISQIRLRRARLRKEEDDEISYLPAELDEDIRNRLLETILEMIRGGELKLAFLLRETLINRIFWPEPPNILQLNLAETKDMKPVEGHLGLALMKFHPKVVANQITLMDSLFFRQIDIQECLYFSHKAIAEDTPTVTAYTNHINSMAWWFATQTLSLKSQSDRDKFLAFMLKLCKRLIQLQNFGSAVNLFAIMNVSSMFRLHWSKRSLERLENHECKKLLQTDSSFKYYRGVLAGAMQKPPVIPYLGGMLSDLTFADQNERYLDKEKTLVNYSKLLVQYSMMTKLHDCVQKDFVSMLRSKKDLEVWNVVRGFQGAIQGLENLYTESRRVVPKGRPL